MSVPAATRDRFSDVERGGWARSESDVWMVAGREVDLPTGQVAAQVIPEHDIRILVASKTTWKRWTEVHTVNTLTLRREAETMSPKAVIRDVTWSGLPQRSRRDVPPADVGITGLVNEMQRLAADLAAADTDVSTATITEWTQRYQHCREAVTRLRTQFDAAEGTFEVVQGHLVRLLG